MTPADVALGYLAALGTGDPDDVASRVTEGFVNEMRNAIRDYLGFAGASRLEWAPHLEKEKRLFRNRP